MLLGAHPQNVIEVIKARVKDPSACLDRKVALVVEGGAMRGVYTGGSLLGLHLASTTRVFDVVYGTSSGAVNAAHFLSGQGHLKAATYYKVLADGKFSHPLRLHRVVDIDFFVGGVLQNLIPLELERVLGQKTPLHVALLNCTDARGEVMRLPDHLATAWDVIKACVAMPVVYNRTIAIGGKQYADGGIPIPFPLQAAIDDGCTDILVLRSRDPYRRVPQRFITARWLYACVFARGRRGLLDLYDQWPNTLNRLGEIAAGNLMSKSGPNIATIAPTSPRVKSSTMNKVALRQACLEMAQETLALFGGDSKELAALEARGII